MSPVTRRGALSLIPAAAAALAPVPVAVAGQEPAEGITSSLAVILAELDAADDAYWQASRRFDDLCKAGLASPSAASDEELGDLQAECYGPFDAMLECPCQTLADARAKVVRMIRSPAGATDFEFSTDEIRAFLTSIAGEA